MTSTLNKKTTLRQVLLWVILSLVLFLLDELGFVYENLGEEIFGYLFMPMIAVIAVFLIVLFFLKKSINFKKLKIDKYAKYAFLFSIISFWIWIATDSIDILFVNMERINLDLILIYFFIKSGIILSFSIVGIIFALISRFKNKMSRYPGKGYTVLPFVYFIILLLALFI